MSYKRTHSIKCVLRYDSFVYACVPSAEICQYLVRKMPVVFHSLDVFKPLILQFSKGIPVLNLSWSSFFVLLFYFFIFFITSFVPMKENYQIGNYLQARFNWNNLKNVNVKYIFLFLYLTVSLTFYRILTQWRFPMSENGNACHIYVMNIKIYSWNIEANLNKNVPFRMLSNEYTVDSFIFMATNFL